ncbi:hypothetical protein SESBI_16949 [Sesbania bispinosa]|nr:hypothetical protein SESBI_16949 [Sesbania bispinosa]
MAEFLFPVLDTVATIQCEERQQQYNARNSGSGTLTRNDDGGTLVGNDDGSTTTKKNDGY